jgi:hypothetical protein
VEVSKGHEVEAYHVICSLKRPLCTSNGHSNAFPGKDLTAIFEENYSTSTFCIPFATSSSRMCSSRMSTSFIIFLPPKVQSSQLHLSFLGGSRGRCLWCLWCLCNLALH